ncbi:RecX family transcriptional regulator [Candidatus Dojkabacteria bacterium]|nr:RecX family transcriptional regulator [Candidatus Dojkabacteria bacterium]
MEITALVRGKRSSRINVFVDKEYSFSVEETTLTRENLFRGKKISEKEIDKIKEKDLVEKLIFRCVELIGRRPRSRGEIRRYVEGKLRNKKYYDFSKEEIENVCSKVAERMESKGYVDDKEFAGWWVRSRKEHRPRGQIVLRQELIKKGIEKEIIDEVLENSYDKSVELETALSLVKRELESLRNKDIAKIEIKLKLSRFLGGKGYRWGIISEVFKQLGL